MKNVTESSDFVFRCISNTHGKDDQN